MVSLRTATVIATCSISMGFYIGKRCGSSPITSNYVFPTGISRSYLPQPTEDAYLQPHLESERLKKAENFGELVKYGFPIDDKLRSYEDFILCYDSRTRIANWVLEHLTTEKVTRMDGVERSKMKFMEDKSFHNYHRATNNDYRHSGYDRGHLAAASNHRHSLSAMNQTFLLSNITPQIGPGFNRDAWNTLEKYIRALARNNKNVYVCTGPLFLPRKEPDGKLYVKYEVIGQNHVAVPTHFYKVILIENQKGYFELQSYVMPNQAISDVQLRDYFMPLETIERAAGLIFFQNIPKSNFRKINAEKVY